MTMLHCRQVAFYFMSDDDNDVDDVFNSGDNFVSGVWCSWFWTSISGDSDHNGDNFDSGVWCPSCWTSISGDNDHNGDNQDRTWSLDWRTVACSPACSYPGAPAHISIPSNFSLQGLPLLEVSTLSSSTMTLVRLLTPLQWKQVEINNLVFIIKHILEWTTLGIQITQTIHRGHSVLHLQRGLPSARLSRTQVQKGGEVTFFTRFFSRFWIFCRD